MAISAKAVSVFIMTFIRFSMKFTCNYVKKYPLPSATLLIIFILHLFFPFIFIFLVFSVPSFLFGYIIYRRSAHSSSKPGTIKLKPVDSIKIMSERFMAVRNRDITKRHNVKPINDDPNRQGDVKRVKFCVSPTDDDNTVDRKEKVEDRDKEVADEPSTEDEEDEDDAPEEGFGNRIMEWTEDDQKNLMEVGFSELEKNLTLETMIAKRNAEKLSMSPRAPDTIVPNVSVTRINPFDEIPGTAPSSFSRNPFYLPGEGFGGGLTVKFDSFDHDLMGPDRNKDKLCRHHSFTRGSNFAAENVRNQESRMLGIFSCMERILAGDSESDKGDHDRFIEELLYQDQASEVASSPSTTEFGEQVTEETAKIPSEVEGSIDSIQGEHAKDPSLRLSSFKSGELNEISNAIETIEILSSTNREILDASTNRTLEKANQTLLNDYVNRNVAQHHSMSSVASDMLVEVSEPASPRNMSPIGELRSLVSEGELDNIKLVSQEQIESSAKPKEVDNSDSISHPTDLVNSAKSQGNTTAESPKMDNEEINNQQPSADNGSGFTNPNEGNTTTEINNQQSSAENGSGFTNPNEVKQLDTMNISASTSQNVGDTANFGTENKEKPDSLTQNSVVVQ